MKKIISITIALLFLFGNTAFAHTGLESSNPTNGSTVTEALNEITLNFETKIEQASSFKVVDANNEPVKVNEMTVSENTMTGLIEESVENGTYKILWKIIGVDGHPIEGEVSFTLNAPVEETSATETEPVITEVQPEDVIVDESSAEEAEESSSNGIIGIVIVLVIVVVGAFWWMMRKKDK